MARTAAAAASGTKPKKTRATKTAGITASSPGPMSKSDAMIGLLSRPKGATIEALMQASGWQAHSVRGFLAGTLKKKGFAVTSEAAASGRLYRISGQGAA